MLGNFESKAIGAASDRDDFVLPVAHVLEGVLVGIMIVRD